MQVDCSFIGVLIFTFFCKNNNPHKPKQIVRAENISGKVETLFFQYDMGDVKLTNVAFEEDYCGFWGAETTPPFQVVKSLQVMHGGSIYKVRKEAYKDLSNVHKIEVISFNNHALIFKLIGGDGVSSYEVKYKLNFKSSELARQCFYTSDYYLVFDESKPSSKSFWMLKNGVITTNN